MTSHRVITGLSVRGRARAASVTQPLRRDCTRAWLSTDGQLFTCSFATRGYDLRALLRGGASDEELAAVIAANWESRTETLTTMGCPIGPLIEAEIRQFLTGVPGVEQVDAEMGLRPPWTPEMMSDEAKAALGFFWYPALPPRPDTWPWVGLVTALRLTRPRGPGCQPQGPTTEQAHIPGERPVG